MFSSFTPIHGGMGGISFYCMPLLTRPPERAKTRSSPKRAHSDRARSASKEAGRPSYLAFTTTPTKSFQSSSFTSPTSWRNGRGRPHVRASDEHLLSVRVPRAQRSPLRPDPPLLPPRHVIPLLNQTPHHRIAVWRIRIERSIRAAH
jgi:hypothetical protein